MLLGSAAIQSIAIAVLHSFEKKITNAISVSE
jgi:hypothetical protein